MIERANGRPALGELSASTARRRMPLLSAIRIFWWAAFMAVVVLTALAISYFTQNKLEIQYWIPDPKSSMDISSFDARHVLLSSADPREGVTWHGTSDTLAQYCGDGREDAIERYAIIFGKFNRYQQVKVTIEGEYASVEISEHYHWRLHDRGVQTPHHASRQPVYYRKFYPPSLLAKRKVPIEKLDGVRSAWVNEYLWDAPQKETNCLRPDGAALLLESCAQGRYFVRYRNCAAEEHEPIEHMRAEITNLSKALMKDVPP